MTSSTSCIELVFSFCRLCFIDSVWALDGHGWGLVHGSKDGLEYTHSSNVLFDNQLGLSEFDSLGSALGLVFGDYLRQD